MSLSWLGALLKLGIIAGMTSVILTSLLGQPRILLSMADDGLLPPAMSRCHSRFKTPHVATVITGVGAALITAVFPLDGSGLCSGPRSELRFTRDMDSNTASCAHESVPSGPQGFRR